MDFVTLMLLLSSVVLIYFRLLRRNSSAKLPPGPFRFPLIGNILQVDHNPHRSLTKLSEIYGPLMSLKLGTKQVIVVSSPEMAKEVLQKHDQICSSRSPPFVSEALNHQEASIVYLPSGSKWRKLRKTCKEHLFTMHKLKAGEGLRQDKIQQLQDYLRECCQSGRVVNVGEVAFVTTLNLISQTLFSLDFACFDSNSTHDMKEIIDGLMKVTGTINAADCFPVLKLIDPRGLKRKAEDYAGKLLATFEEIISERLQSKNKKKDFLQVLLDLNQENDADLSHNDMKHLFLDLIVAGTHTSSDSALWAMTELLHNREKMWKAKKEVKSMIGEKKQVEELDISRLPYLGAVMKETLRCHPPAPFLIPHKAEADVEIDGYKIPKDAEILVNIWAISRDPRIWSNPDSFEPERFLESKIDYKGKDFELVPFGSGRRICPGMPLAQLMLPLILACMLYNFDWEIEAGINGQELDMSEAFGFSLHKAVPLMAFPINNSSVS